MKQFLLLWVGLCLSVANAYDQSTIDEQVVIATGNPVAKNNLTAPIEVISQQDIEAIGSNNILDILKTSASIQTFDLSSSGGRGQIVMRGFGDNSSNNIAVVIDGVKVNNPSLEAPLLSQITVDQIERIEILRGSGSVLYGDQAVAGVIRIITKKNKQNQVSTHLATGSFNHNYTQVQLTQSLSKRSYLNVNGTAATSDNYRENNQSYKDTLQLQLSTTQDKLSSLLHWHYIDDQLNLPGALFNLNDRRASQNDEDFTDNIIHIGKLQTKWQVSNQLQLQAEWHTRATDRKGFSFGNTFTGTIGSENIAITSLWQTQLEQWQISTNFGLETNRAGATSFGNVNHQKQVAVYAQGIATLDKVALNGGLRLTEINDSYKHVANSQNNLRAWELGLNYQINALFQLSSRLSSSFRIANADEFSYASDDGLQPQTSENIDLSISFAKDGEVWQFNWYRMDIDNEITFDPSQGDFGLNTNLPSALRSGWQLDWQREYSTIIWAFQIASIDAIFNSGTFNGNRVPLIADYNSTLSLTLKNNEHWQTYFDVQYLAERYSAGDFANQYPKMSNQIVYNAHLRYRQNDRTQISLRFNNLFKERYNLYQGYTQGSPYYYPAALNSWIINLNVKF